MAVEPRRSDHKAMVVRVMLHCSSNDGSKKQDPLIDSHLGVLSISEKFLLSEILDQHFLSFLHMACYDCDGTNCNVQSFVSFLK